MKRFKNDQKVDVTFELKNAVYKVNPGETISVPDELAYAIPLMGVRLTDLDNVNKADDDAPAQPKAPKGGKPFERPSKDQPE